MRGEKKIEKERERERGREDRREGERKRKGGGKLKREGVCVYVFGRHHLSHAHKLMHTSV